MEELIFATTINGRQCSLPNPVLPTRNHKSYSNRHQNTYLIRGESLLMPIMDFSYVRSNWTVSIVCFDYSLVGSWSSLGLSGRRTTLN